MHGELAWDVREIKSDLVEAIRCGELDREGVVFLGGGKVGFVIGLVAEELVGRFDVPVRNVLF